MFLHIGVTIKTKGHENYEQKEHNSDSLKNNFGIDKFSAT